MVVDQPVTLRPKKNAMTTSSFVEKNKFGDGRGDDSDMEEDPAYADKTPTTRRKLHQEDEVKAMTKLGPWATAFTIFKGFVATGILYMPKSFINGGWLFSVVALIFSLFMTLCCIRLLIETREKIGGSFSEIGQKTYGKCGKIMVDITLFGSQVGFVTAYIYFIAS